MLVRQLSSDSAVSALLHGRLRGGADFFAVLAAFLFSLVFRRFFSIFPRRPSEFGLANSEQEQRANGGSAGGGGAADRRRECRPTGPGAPSALSACRKTDCGETREGGTGNLHTGSGASGPYAGCGLGEATESPSPEDSAFTFSIEELGVIPLPTPSLSVSFFFVFF